MSSDRKRKADAVTRSTEADNKRQQAAITGGLGQAVPDATPRRSYLPRAGLDLLQADNDTLRAVDAYRETRQIDVSGSSVPAPMQRFESQLCQGETEQGENARTGHLRQFDRTY
jgi:hypothetical protein